MQRLFVLSMSTVAIIYGGDSIAETVHLKGTYGFTGTDACLVSRAGFNANLQPLGVSFSNSGSVEGIRTFKGDGTGINESTGVTITIPVGSVPSASSSHSTASVIYNVNADGSFTSNNVPGTFKGTILTGTRAGQTFTLENVPTTTGLISESGKTLTLATLTPGVETEIFSNGDIQFRICHRSRVFIKLDTD
jgi:hypothetical protein